VSEVHSLSDNRIAHSQAVDGTSGSDRCGLVGGGAFPRCLTGVYFRSERVFPETTPVGDTGGVVREWWGDPLGVTG
jgi:hypothetical protein